MHSTDFNRVISFLKKHDQHISSLPSMHCLRGETLLSFVHFIATVVCFKMIMIKNANSEEGWLNSVHLYASRDKLGGILSTYQCMNKLTPTGEAPSVINSTKVDTRLIGEIR